MNIEYIDIKDIQPAPYNPRVITQEQMSQLVESVRNIGVVMPILINADSGIIIAGHQRTQACQKAGIDRVPCFKIQGLKDGDEIKFNQLHNGCDTHEKSFPHIDGLHEGFNSVCVKNIPVKTGGGRKHLS